MEHDDTPLKIQQSQDVRRRRADARCTYASCVYFCTAITRTCACTRGYLRESPDEYERSKYIYRALNERGI